jgi:beta-N-acetylhexosaminidase
MRIPHLLLLTCLCFPGKAVQAKKRNDSLDIKIGQMIMIGIGDRTSLSDSDQLAFDLAEGKIGGVVLFEKNIAKTQSYDSLQLLIRRMKYKSRFPLFISVDEEGGKVHRLKEKYGFPAMPSAQYLGNLDDEDSTLFFNRRLASTLKELGFNLNYAPTVDLAVNPDNPVIVRNGRSFGADRDRVVKHASLCVKAHHEFGVSTVLKHFPGHGSSLGDTHEGVVNVTETWSLSELLPYEQLLRTSGVDAVMIGHMVNHRWDPEMHPATLSRSTVSLLRNLLGFAGAVFSDDMQMQAIANRYGLEQAIMLSINAGVDVIMFANTLPDKSKFVTASQVHGIIKKLVRKKKISRQRINEAYARIASLKLSRLN